MTAFDELLNKSSISNFGQYRKELISNRGDLASGGMATAMDLSYRARNNSLFEEENQDDSSRQISKIFLRRKTSGEDFGFVFDLNGTEKIIKKISSDSPIKLFDDFSENFFFVNEAKKVIWEKASKQSQKRLIAENVNKMVKKTDMEYRIHGDRLHYLVIGKVSTIERSKNGIREEKTYPLFLFSCSETDRTKLTVEVEQAGFLNFWLDEKILENNVSNMLNGLEITIDQQLPLKLVNIQQKLNKLILTTAENVEFDPSFSMIGIITGFETEYIDLAWKEILK